MEKYQKGAKYDRHICIIKALARGRRITQSSLMAFFNISEKTIKKDLAELGRVFPIDTFRGFGGGIILRECHAINKFIMCNDMIALLHAALSTFSEIKTNPNACALLEILNPSKLTKSHAHINNRSVQKYRRQINILNDLALHKKTTVSCLAQKHGVSKTIIKRDIFELDYYFKIDARSGNSGGIYLYNDHIASGGINAREHLDILAVALSEYVKTHDNAETMFLLNVVSLRK